MEEQGSNESAEKSLDWLRAYEITKVEGTKIIRELIVPKKKESTLDLKK